MTYTELGSTGLSISRLGVGMAEIGFQLSADDVETTRRVLGRALDLGINFIDTAGCYGVAEALIGQAVAGRRGEFVLASKTGHMTDGCSDDGWDYESVLASIDRSLQRMQTEVIDLMQLHTCDIPTLERGEAIRALKDAKAQGKIRFLGYSGDNEAAIWAARSGEFDVIQTSFNLVDQGARRGLLQEVRSRSLGLIAKRPILNGVWRAESDPDPYGNGYGSEYFQRQKKVAGSDRLPGEPNDRIAASLGFTLGHPEVSVAIVGTKNPDHLQSNISIADDPVSDEFISAAHEAFDRFGGSWEQRS